MHPNAQTSVEVSPTCLRTSRGRDKVCVLGGATVGSSTTWEALAAGKRSPAVDLDVDSPSLTPFPTKPRFSTRQDTPSRTHAPTPCTQKKNTRTHGTHQHVASLHNSSASIASRWNSNRRRRTSRTAPADMGFLGALDLLFRGPSDSGCGRGGNRYSCMSEGRSKFRRLTWDRKAFTQRSAGEGNPESRKPIGLPGGSSAQGGTRTRYALDAIANHEISSQCRR